MSEIKYLIVVYNTYTQTFKNEYFETFEEFEKRLKFLRKVKGIEVRKTFEVKEYEKEKWKY